MKNPTNYERPNLVRKQLKDISFGEGVNLVDANGKSHALQRKMLNPAFSHASVQKFIHIFQAKADELVKVIPIHLQQQFKYQTSTLIL